MSEGQEDGRNPEEHQEGPARHLEAANSLNAGNTLFTVYLHDADVGWALLLQNTLMIEAVVALTCSSP